MGWDPPVGDPGGMRARAAEIGRQSDRLGYAISQVDRAAAAMIYQCRAGVTLGEIVAQRRGRARRLAAELEALQGAMLREAAALEDEQQAWQRMLRRPGAM